MIKVINNYLRSGHQFLDDENVQRFRFGLLNFLMVIAAVLTFINLLKYK
jgi:hypothetical protein